jgi:hypothetical protein
MPTQQALKVVLGSQKMEKVMKNVKQGSVANSHIQHKHQVGQENGIS